MAEVLSPKHQAERTAVHVDTRNYGIDLLRMVSMLMIVCLHVLGRGGILEATQKLSINYEVAWFLEIAAYCAVNCYALISGYVGVFSKYKYTNIIILWFQVIFYTLTMMSVEILIDPSCFSFQKVLMAFIPVLSRKYWYFTDYFLLFFFIPLFNKAILSMSKKQLKFVIIMIVLLISGAETGVGIFSLLGCEFNDSGAFLSNHGYSMLWLSVLYLVGGYIRKYDSFRKLKKKKLFIVYLLCVIVSWGVKLLSELSILHFGKAILPNNVLIHYTSPTIFVASIMLLVIFSKMTTFSRQINYIIARLSPLSFGVYLIHLSHFVWKRLYNRFTYFADYNTIKMLVLILIATLAIYFGCIIIEALRQKLFEVFKIKQHIWNLEQKWLSNLWEN